MYVCMQCIMHVLKFLINDCSIRVFQLLFINFAYKIYFTT